MEKKGEKKNPNAGFDLKSMMRESLLQIATEECNITKEQAEYEFGDTINELIYSDKPEDDRDWIDNYWESFKEIIFYFERIQGADNTWYWMSNREETESFKNSFKRLCTLSENDEYEERILELIGMYDIERNRLLADFFLSPVKCSHYINDFICKQFQKGREFWEKEFHGMTAYEKRKVEDCFGPLELNFPYLKEFINQFKINNCVNDKI